MLKLFFLALLLIPALPAQQPKPDPHSPENAARTALIDSLDRLAATQTAARRADVARIITLDQAKARQAHVRSTMFRLLGPLPERTPLNPQSLGETRAPGILIHKVLFDSQPSFHVTALLYTPDPLPKAKLPAIVMAPGHSPLGKAGDFAFAAAFARAGFAVLSYDPLGQGERLQYPDPVTGKTLAKGPTGEHGEAGLQPVLLGESVAKYFLWDGIRAVDYLQTRPEIDPTRIGAFGCSGGGAMTALLGALDPRIAAVGTACYLTSWDTLLPSIGPQDGEQSTPGWIAAGLDFPDWVELAAPKPYAMIGTTEDMFPYAGFQSTAAESTRFYALYPGASRLQQITGPGGHGNLTPLLPQILAFFTRALGATPTFIPPGTPHTGPLDARGRELPPPDSMQVTPTGQVSTSYPGAATVFTLNLAHARTLPKPQPLSRSQLAEAVRTVLGPPVQRAPIVPSNEQAQRTVVSFHHVTYTVESFEQEPGVRLPYDLAVPPGSPARATLLLTETLPYPSQSQPVPESLTGSRIDQLSTAGRVVLAFAPRPSPPGSEELKAQILGPYYLLGLRAELTGQTLLGMRVDDVLHAVDYLQASFALKEITAEASGHNALVLLHAAILDPRLKHITLRDLPPTYADLLATPLPQDAPQDILPGVLLHYDTPGLIKALGSRVTIQTTPPQAIPSNLR